MKAAETKATEMETAGTAEMVEMEAVETAGTAEMETAEIQRKKHR